MKFGKFSRALMLGAVSAVAINSASFAADSVAEAPATGFNWSGVYVGFGGGVGANVHEVSSPLTAPDFSFNGIGGEGVFGEVTLGYDYLVSPRFLIGGLVDAHFGNIATKIDAAPFADLSVTEKYGFDVGLRAGYLVTPSTLGYVLGGYAWQKSELDANGGGLGGGGSFDWDKDGYFLGVGVETVVASNWTLKTEYRYTRFSTANILSEFGLPDGFLDTDTSRHTFSVAANYRFGAQNGGAAAFESPAYSWTGFYVGGNVGAGAAVHELGLGGVASFNGIGGEGAFGELNVGYDHEFGGNWVAGVQLGGRYSGITSEINFGPGKLNLDADYGFDVLARVGMKLNESTLAYVLGGYSWQHFDLVASGGGSSQSLIDWNAGGFSVGGGLEAAVTNNMTVNLEYRYAQYQSEDFDSMGFFEVTPSSHTVRVGAKYKFN